MDGCQIYEVTMDSCGCDQVEPLEIQLLRSRYFPATIDNPWTVATFECLDLFVTLSSESKLTVYQYCQAMERRTDNSGLRTLPVCCFSGHRLIWLGQDRQKEFCWMVHEWCHLLMLKRAGIADQLQPINELPDGSCALLCPCCPNPGINLPEGWNTEPEEKRSVIWTFLVNHLPIVKVDIPTISEHGL